MLEIGPLLQPLRSRGFCTHDSLRRCTARARGCQVNTHPTSSNCVYKAKRHRACIVHLCTARIDIENNTESERLTRLIGMAGREDRAERCDDHKPSTSDHCGFQETSGHPFVQFRTAYSRRFACLADCTSEAVIEGQQTFRGGQFRQKGLHPVLWRPATRMDVHL